MADRGLLIVFSGPSRGWKKERSDEILKTRTISFSILYRWRRVTGVRWSGWCVDYFPYVTWRIWRFDPSRANVGVRWSTLEVLWDSLTYVNETLDKESMYSLEVSSGCTSSRKKWIFIFCSAWFGWIAGSISGSWDQMVQKLRNGLRKAKEEIAMMREYDYAIVNDRVPLAAERVKRVIEAEHFRVDRVIGHYLDMLPKTQTMWRDK